MRLPEPVLLDSTYTYRLLSASCTTAATASPAKVLAAGLTTGNACPLFAMRAETTLEADGRVAVAEVPAVKPSTSFAEPLPICTRLLACVVCEVRRMPTPSRRTIIAVCTAVMSLNAPLAASDSAICPRTVPESLVLTTSLPSG